MRRVVILIVILFTTLFGASAQSVYGDDAKADVKMKYVYSFEEALAKSKKEGKLIFFNCFADWAVPCHLMNQVVFSDQEFADWMDKHFVNFFIDVTTREGRPLAEKYDIQRMAHYLVLDSEGSVVHRIIGGHEIAEFKRLLEKALNPKTTYAAVKARYESGDRGVKFLREAYETFDIAYETELKREVLEKVFASLKPKQWSKNENWPFFSQKAGASVDNEYFKYLVEHKSDFLKENKKEDVDRLLSGGYFGVILPYATGAEEYDGNKFLDLILEI